MNTSLKRSLLVAASAALCAGAAQAQAGTYRTICEESFDLPAGTNLGQTGSGTGWEAAWYSGPTDDNAVAIPPTPGTTIGDAVGNIAFMTNTLNDGGNYRRISGDGFDNITDDMFGAATGPLYGKDDTTIWVTFDVQRIPGGDDAYGGLSLFIFLDPNGVGEYLFMGSPFLFDDWGLDTPTGPPGATTIGQGGINQPAHMVYRIDFLPGDERVQFWLNPATDKPVGGADLDVMVPNFRFNELRIQSGTGGGTVGGSVPGYYFDGIKLECEDCDPPKALEGTPSTLSVSFGGNQSLLLNAGVGNAGKTYFLLGSASGTSPGFPIDGLTLPLNFDSYFVYTLTYANQPPLTNSFGALDAAGAAQANFNMPIGIVPLVGQQINHAYVVIDFAGIIPFVGFVSNAVSLDITN